MTQHKSKIASLALNYMAISRLDLIITSYLRDFSFSNDLPIYSETWLAILEYINEADVEI